jgi:hypothetical protein
MIVTAMEISTVAKREKMIRHLWACLLRLTFPNPSIKRAYAFARRLGLSIEEIWPERMYR